jgi:hypothetical protein
MLPIFIAKEMFAAGGMLPLAVLPSPWSLLVFDLTPFALLLMDGAFFWRSLLRTWIIALSRLPIVSPQSSRPEDELGLIWTSAR